ncbi:MAG: MarR family transcriptional regulator [Pseudomonadota bacterium]
MTETTDSARSDGPARLSPAMEQFILHWGEMGQRWGVNRSQAQIHALLHLSPQPLPAEAIAETLGIARSNVSTALKELQGWKLVRVERKLGDRRDHFAAEEDMFELVSNVIEGRRAREFAPTIERVRACAEAAEGDAETPAHARRRLRETLEMMERFDAWYREIAALPRSSQKTLLTLGAQIARLLPKAAADE